MKSNMYGCNVRKLGSNEMIYIYIVSSYVNFFGKFGRLKVSVNLGERNKEGPFLLDLCFGRIQGFDLVF